MSTHYIDTVEQFKTLRDQLKPTMITSKKYGKIPVPCACTILVARDMIKANGYNPNSVSKDKMKLLQRSIRDNGYCFPIVTIWDETDERFIIIDGFHRNIMSTSEWLDLDYVPLVFVDHDISKRMYATVQFNKARGVHQVDLDADVIRALIEQGNSEDDIATHLGIDIDTIHRYKQLTGIADLFKNANWSPSWSAVEGAEVSDV